MHDSIVRSLAAAVIVCAALPAMLHAAEPAPAQTPLRLPVIFGDHMVMQRDRSVPVWGWAGPGDEVRVEVAGQRKRATADATGRWSVQLDPVAAGGPHTMAIHGGDTTVTYEDVLFGEVWFCGGQSNMEWSMRNANGYEEELDAVRHDPPPIRQIKIERRVRAEPESLGAAGQGWVVNDGPALSHFTAVGYFFAREIQRELDVPVGLVNCNWGGSKIEPWIPREVFEARPAFADDARWLVEVESDYEASRRAAVGAIRAWLEPAERALSEGGDVPPPPAWPPHPIAADRQSPTGMYNAMVAPLAGYGIRGFLWYQGESNREDRGFYTDLMLGLIDGWRDAWGEPELPFYYVQIAPFAYRDSPGALPDLQDAQRRVLEKAAGVGMAVITDLGDLDDIHPRRKRPVGERLARLALADTYGRDDIDPSGPLVRACSLDGGQLRITFDFAQGLTTADGEPPAGFEVAGADGVFVPVDAAIDGAAVILDLPASLAAPARVRYAWSDLGGGNLVDGSALPASPFQMAVE